jgi:hypothetical protein
MTAIGKDAGAPTLPRLGSRQWEMLDRICRTNGGGIYVPGGGAEHKTIMRLHELGYVQGKAGQPYCAVHTRDGLQVWRDWKSAQ